MKGVGVCRIVASLNWTSCNKSGLREDGSLVCEVGVAKVGGISGDLVHVCSSETSN